MYSAHGSAVEQNNLEFQSEGDGDVRGRGECARREEELRDIKNSPGEGKKGSFNW